MNLEFKHLDSKLVPCNLAAHSYVNNLKHDECVELNFVETSTGTWPMLKTWRKWCSEVALHMASGGAWMPLFPNCVNGESKGKRPFNADDAHISFTHMFLGSNDDGVRYSWGLSKKDNIEVAPKSRRLYAMDKMVEWCAREGIKITIPNNSEFRKLMEDQEK